MAVKKTKTPKIEEVKEEKTKKPVKAKSAKTPKAADTSSAPVPTEDKKKIIEEFATKKGDTGSPEVQIALLTKRIENLVTHLKQNQSDNHSRRGLLGMVSKRRRLINYLAKKDADRVKDITSKLKLK